MTYKGLTVEWRSFDVTCPKGHGRFLITDKKQIFQLAKTGKWYCFQCEKFWDLKGQNGIKQ